MSIHLAAPQAPCLADLPRRRLARMLEAGEAALAARAAILARGSNPVAEVLQGQGTFYEFSHYPEGDVFDPATGAQFYYHAHRRIEGEHGHFHTFARRGYAGGVIRPPTHLVAIAMDDFGEPMALFAVNRWVTDEAWVPAATAIKLLPRFVLRPPAPHPELAAWITAMLQLYQPEIETLLHHRDAVLDATGEPRARALEDRAIETTGSLPIDPAARVDELRRLLRQPAARAGFRKG